MQMRTLATTLLLALGTGCISGSAERGVPVARSSTDDDSVGTTTRGDALQRLGPPWQVLTSKDGSAFDYRLERTEASGLILLLYNARTETIDYDRAVFCFDQDGLLVERAAGATTERRSRS